jgi:threonylcarbamoyladenosine tRNA methylthiotransferase MtaB
MIVHFETLGCKLNQIESESAARSFNDAGFDCSMVPLTAGTQLTEQQIQDTRLCVINTCTVTSKAEQKARRIIRLLLEKLPNCCVLVTGCYAELDQVLIQQISPRIVVLKGTHKDGLSELPVFLLDLLQKTPTITAEELVSQIRFQCTQANEKPIQPFKLSTDTFLQHSRSSIKIQDGCNNRCSYCRICLARGKSISLEAEEVLHRVQQLEEQQHKEVVITGVNLSQYKSPDTHMDIAQLLQYVLDNTKSIAIRISSLYPERVDSALCTVIKNKRIRPHFHLSVQSGSDTILKAMNRPYEAQQVIDAVDRLRQVKENPFIACDIITGFPGETAEDFQHTLDMCKRCNFTWIHAFPFSPRPGTKAYTMKPQIPQSVSGERVKVLTELALHNKKEYIQQFIGKEVTAIIEKRHTISLKAVTENFLHVQLKGKTDSSLGGSEVKVRILEAQDMQHLSEEKEGIAEIVSLL